MSLLTFFEIFSKKTPLTKILGPNPWARNDPMVILYQLFGGKFDLTLFFQSIFNFFNGKTLFHFKPSGIYFEWFLFPS